MKINIIASAEYEDLIKEILANLKYSDNKNVDVHIQLTESADSPTYKDISELLQVSLDQSNKTLETLINYLKSTSNHS